jgi:hypothetical protein
MSVSARFTTDERRIKRLQENYDLGVERERINHRQREQEDIALLHCSHSSIVALHSRALKARVKLMEKKRRQHDEEDAEDN